MTHAPAVSRIHMELASPDPDRALVASLLGTFTTRASAYQLAQATADAIIAKLEWTDVTIPIPIRNRPALTAWWILNMPDDTTAILDELGTDGLAATCIALLSIWCDACDNATATALTDTGGTERALEALLSAADPETAPRPVRDTPNPADGRTARGAGD